METHNFAYLFLELSALILAMLLGIGAIKKSCIKFINVVRIATLMFVVWFLIDQTALKLRLWSFPEKANSYIMAGLPIEEYLLFFSTQQSVCFLSGLQRMNDYYIFNLILLIISCVSVYAFCKTLSDIKCCATASVAMVSIGFPWDYFAIKNAIWVYPTNPGILIYDVPLNDLWFIVNCTLIASSLLVRFAFR